MMEEISIYDMITGLGSFIIRCLEFLATDYLGIIALGLCAVAFGFAFFYNVSGAEKL